MQGEAIQGSTKARDIPLFSNFIVDGKHYKIKGFYTYENISVNMVLENDAIIDLKLDTIFFLFLQLSCQCRGISSGSLTSLIFFPKEMDQ
ncbi:hypothetical protein NC652_004657 [Populus alba x Populus x berolinensis]|nr:hypothetical protein NC652_004657 [Populus alba x Populus x berolinensis]